MTMATPTRRGSGRVTGLLRFAGSLVVAAALLVGVPWGLRVIGGNPLDRLPDLLAGDTSSGVILAVLTAVLWVAWAQFVVAFAVELVSAIRGTPVPARIRFPGFGVQQGLARALISGALMLAPVATTAVAPAAAVMAMPPPVAAASITMDSPQRAPAPMGATVTLTADGPRTWWDLADTHLGDGAQWRQLWDLNVGRVQPDGTAMQSSTAPLRAGWTVQLPAGSTAPGPADVPVDVTVQPGQTLSQIAEDHGHGWPDVWTANAGRTQPGGVLDDPDYLEPGWTITIPSPAAAPNAGEDVVTVQTGDTLGEIAAEHSTDVQTLMAINAEVTQPDGDRLNDPNLIEPGWVLHVSTPASSAAGQDGPSAAATQTGPVEPDPPAGHQTAPGIGVPSADPGGVATAPDAPPSAGQRPSVNPGGAAAAPDGSSSATAAVAAPTTGAGTSGSRVTSDDQVGAGQGESTAVSTVAVFAGAGALLAALLLTTLLRARARQRGYRRPGELPAAVSEQLSDIERVLRSAGGAAAADAQWLDEALHGLGQLTAATTDGVLPEVLAVAVSVDELRLVLAAPAPRAVGAWQTRDDGRQWVLSRHADTGYDAATRTRMMPPYPTLVTVGSSDDGVHWLLDLERIGSLTLTGDPQRSADLARFMAAELAHNSWSELLQVTLVGIGAEMAQMYPERLTYADDPGQTLAAAAAQLRAVQRTETTVLAGRTGAVGGEAFAAHVVLIDPAAVPDREPLDGLMSAVTEHPDRSTVALVVTTAEPSSAEQRAWEIHVDQDGTLTIPPLGLRLGAQQLPQAQAGQLAQLLALAAGPGRWVGPPTAQLPVGIEDRVPGVTTLPAADVDLVTATTWEDLQTLAEPVPSLVGDRFTAGDPDLDKDLAQWVDPESSWPRIAVLGPVDVRPHGALTKRKLSALRAEAAVHLAVHSAGVTAERLASDLWPTEAGIAGSRLRQMVYDLRKQFGVNPRTDAEYLPRSEDADGLYRLDDVLVDGELFRRLRLRASHRDDQRLRVQDWWQALDLVRGVPFSGVRSGGCAWLADQQIDEEYRSLIVDIAHQLATHHLEVGEPALAEKAARVAMTVFDPADPVADICLLDLVWSCDAQGRRAEGDAYADQIKANHGEVLEDCPPRTYQLLMRRQQRAA